MTTSTARRHPPYLYPWAMALVAGALLGPLIGMIVLGPGALVLLPAEALFGVAAASAAFGMAISLRWAGPWRAGLGAGVPALLIGGAGLLALVVFFAAAPTWRLALAAAVAYACAVVATRTLLFERYA